MYDEHASSEQPLPRSQEQQIDGLCREFEQQWHAGERPRIEDCLSRVASPMRAALLIHLIAWEIEQRQASEGQFAIEQYYQRFPHDRAAVDAGRALVDSRARPDQGPASTVNSSRDGDGDTGSDRAEVDPDQPLPVPRKIGRYEIRELLGRGAFGWVYAAYDTQLQREVALKVPGPTRLSSAMSLDSFLEEARAAARLKHPGLVAVYDVQQDGDDVCIVQEYIDGQDLARWARASNPSVQQIVTLIKEVVEAVGFAHQHDLVHRDLKPANLLVDRQGHPHVADFGLALDESMQRLCRGEICGTPAYMSPEQVRGLTHLLDGRSDLWSIGVILYELLTRRQPFGGANHAEVFEEVEQRYPKPPRMIRPDIPAELERICLKCLEKRQTDRYTSAAELLEDLEAWSRQCSTTTPTSQSADRQPVQDSSRAAKPMSSQVSGSASFSGDMRRDKLHVLRIVPKGLRSFDEQDADFFLELLPGPRDREGLPESIRFWKLRVEQTDPEKAFRVGLIYGPSGCGKSSLVKAGLLPRLAPHVVPVYLEATPDDTELRLFAGLRRRCSSIPDELSLPDILAGIREGLWVPERTKVCVVLDQFEQWLHAHRGEPDTQLVQALRHCDGGRVQCIVLVRDDFWMPATRFLGDLEIRLLEGDNSRSVDLFDTLHARKVLAAFGRAYGRLPEEAVELSKEQELFLDRAVEGLAQDGKIICVRLALFADMLKGKPWTMATLSQVGGTEGLGASFLEETFSAYAAPAAHRYHQQAAQVVLKALLPEAGTDIKGSRQSYTALLEASGYAKRPGDFGDLIQILDGEIRLITPTVPEGQDGETRSSPSTSQPPPDSHMRHYQLTHDYLVPSLRDWLTRKQKATRRGRAELKLAERSALWNAMPENRHLPSFWEFAGIRTLTRSKRWTEPQRKMMTRARNVLRLRASVIIVLLVVALMGALAARQQLRSRARQQYASNLAQQVVTADLNNVRTLIQQLDEYRELADPALRQALNAYGNDTSQRLNASLALLPSDADQAHFLAQRLRSALPAETLVIRQALSQITVPERVTRELWSRLEGQTATPSKEVLPAASTLAELQCDDARWQQHSPIVAEALVQANPVYLGGWKDLLWDVKSQLSPTLIRIYQDHAESRSTSQRELATMILAEYAADQPGALAELLMTGNATQFSALFDAAAQPNNRQTVVDHCRRELQVVLHPDWQDPPVDPQWKQPDGVVQTQFETAQGMIAERFAFVQAMPWEQFLEIVDTLDACGYRPARVRPYRAGDQLLVAAVWNRDGGKTRLDNELTAEQITQAATTAEKFGWLPCDVAGYVPVADDQAGEVRYVLLWSSPAASGEARHVVIGLTQEEFPQRANALAQESFTSQIAFHVMTDVTGHRRYSGIWSNQGATSTAVAAHGGWERLDQPQWDVSLADEGPLCNPLEQYRQQLAEIERLPPGQADDPTVRLARAFARYHLGQLESALIDLDFLVDKQAIAVSVLPLRIWTLARLDKADEARSELAKYWELDKEASTRSYVQIALEAWLGNLDEAARQLDSMEATSPQNSDALYLVASAAALASQACAESDAERSRTFADRTLLLLAAAISHGYDDTKQLRTDIDLARLHGDPRFVSLLDKLEPPGRYAALWRAEVEVESAWIAQQSLESLLEEARELASRGFRPVATTVAVLPGNATRGSSSLTASLTPQASMVWHRPLIPDGKKEQLAARQANAAVVLLRLQPADEVWPLLRHQPDPRLRSHLLDRLASHGAEPESLWQRLAVEKDDSIRRALILGLGDFAAAGQVSAEQQPAISAELLRLYREDPDPGIHGAAEWGLKQLRQQSELARVRSALATGERIGPRRWYVTKQNQHSMVILDAQEPFVMGSPISEVERFGGPTGPNEVRHRRRIGRTFAIASEEVTVQQFQAFQADHAFSRQYSREPDAPVNTVTWYQAAQYCNWLSQQEGIPEEQWCYDPSESFADGMRLRTDYLQRTGYRLPTEAEWEYACRAGTITARHYGETETLLDRYAWYIKNSQDRWTLPVGSLKPNDSGLFDMLGNLQEWCQDSARLYPTDRPIVDDAEQKEEVRNSVVRMLRGVAFNFKAGSVRSANRNNYRPADRSNVNGFRVARTYP